MRHASAWYSDQRLTIASNAGSGVRTRDRPTRRSLPRADGRARPPRARAPASPYVSSEPRAPRRRCAPAPSSDDDLARLAGASVDARTAAPRTDRARRRCARASDARGRSAARRGGGRRCGRGTRGGRPCSSVTGSLIAQNATPVGERRRRSSCARRSPGASASNDVCTWCCVCSRCTPSVHSTYAVTVSRRGRAAAVRDAQQRDLHRLVRRDAERQLASRCRRARARTSSVPAPCRTVYGARRRGSAPASRSTARPSPRRAGTAPRSTGSLTGSLCHGVRRKK